MLLFKKGTLRLLFQYTVLIRDRALVADKGYIVKAARQEPK